MRKVVAKKGCRTKAVGEVRQTGLRDARESAEELRRQAEINGPRRLKELFAGTTQGW